MTTRPPVFVATIALCGGTSRRMGVPDKTALPFGDATVLDSALAGLAPGLVVCVGEPRPLRELPAAASAAAARRIVWAREDPVGTGPVAGIRAGLDSTFAELEQGGPQAGTPSLDQCEPLVAIIAGDQPFAGRVVPHLVEVLTRSLREGPRGAVPDGVAVAAPGRSGPSLLLAVYRLRALDAAIGDDPADRGVYETLRDLTIEVAQADRFSTEQLAIDVDDRADLERATALLKRME